MKEGGWDGGIQEEPARPPASSLIMEESPGVGRSSTGLLIKSPSKGKRKKSVRFNNAVTVKVVPRISQFAPPKTSFITGTLLDPTTRTFRYLLLFLLCLQTYGPDFTRFSPNILQDNLQSLFGISSQNFFLVLLVVADIPALILVLVGGYLLDKYFTVGKWAIGFAVGVVVGQLVFALGAFLKSLAVLMAGRVLFQASAGCLYVAQATSMARWLAGLEMGLAVGITLSLAELVEYFASWMLPLAANDYGIGESLVLGALMAVASLSATVLASALDAWGNDQLPRPPRDSVFRPQPQTVVTTTTMTATMTTTSPASSSLQRPSVAPPPSQSTVSSPPALEESLPPPPPQPSPPKTPPLSIRQSPPRSTSHSPSRSPSRASKSPSSPLSPSPSSRQKSPSQSRASLSPPRKSTQLEEFVSPTSDSISLTTPTQIDSQPDIHEDAHEDIHEDTHEDTQEEDAQEERHEETHQDSQSQPTSVNEEVPISLSDSSDEETESLETSKLLQSKTYDSLRARNLKISKRTTTADPEVPTTSAAAPRSVSATYGTNVLGAAIETREKTPRQINEEGGHFQLLVMLVVASLLILPSGILSINLENILYYAAAAAPGVGWVIDRAGRPSVFLGLGAIAQLALLLTSIFARVLHGYTPNVDTAVQVILGIAWSVTVCSAYAGLALLVSGGWGGCAFAAVTVANAAAISLAPLFYAFAHPMEILIPTAISTAAGLLILILLYSKRSILNMNSHDIRRVIGYTLDSDEKLPLVTNPL